MAPCLRIRHVVKTDRSDTHELIQAICGIKPDGSHWSLTQDEAISQIEDGIAVFYVERAGGRRFEVIVAMDSCPQIPQNGRGWRTAGRTSLSTELPEPRGRNKSSICEALDVEAWADTTHRPYSRRVQRLVNRTKT
jgi:Protein of unknown function (DUF3892)